MKRSKRVQKTLILKKGGFQCPMEYIEGPQDFSHLELPNGWLYCRRGHFIFNHLEQKELFFQNKPCVYTDTRYFSGDDIIPVPENVTYKWLKIFLKNLAGLKKNMGLKLVSVYGIKGQPHIDLSYLYVAKSDRKGLPVFKRNYKNLTNKFSDNDEKSNNLIELLRKNNFVVDVINGEIAECRGKTKSGENIRFGFSSFDNKFGGLDLGCENILFDLDDNFNKWKQCKTIDKKWPNEKIVDYLLCYNSDVALYRQRVLEKLLKG